MLSIFKNLLTNFFYRTSSSRAEQHSKVLMPQTDGGTMHAHSVGAVFKAIMNKSGVTIAESFVINLYTGNKIFFFFKKTYLIIILKKILTSTINVFIILGIS